MAKQSKDNVWIRLPKQVTFQFPTKCGEWRGRLDVDRYTVPDRQTPI